MSEKEIRELIERNLSPENQSISTETALKAARKIIVIAEKENVSQALAGGIAMHLYGFTRATKDVDFVASQVLSVQVSRYLSFGGVRYEIETENRQVAVDWIVRNDRYQKIYQAALRDAVTLDNGLKIITPEWLIVMKYTAGRGKDTLDLQWLLQQKGLVKRGKLRENLINLLGADGAEGYLIGIQRFFDLADLRTKLPEGDENESYRPDGVFPEYNEE